MTKTQREYKDRLFRFLFGSSEHKDWSLQLYNILMGTEFSDPDQLTLFTLENVLYKTWKNDIAMIGPDGRLLLVEQQSKEDKDEALIASIEKRTAELYDLILANESMKRLSKAEIALNNLINEINETLISYVSPESSCSGSCSTCGGCH